MLALVYQFFPPDILPYLLQNKYKGLLILTSGCTKMVFRQHKQASISFWLLDRTRQFKSIGTTPQSINAFKCASIPLATEPKV